MDHIAYAEMNFTRKEKSQDNSISVVPEVSPQSDDITVTYAAVRNTPGKKKPGKIQQVSPQSDDITYAAVRKTPGKKKENSDKPQQVSPQSEDTTISYSVVRKPQKPAEEAHPATAKERRHVAGWMEMLLQCKGTRWYLFLVPTLIAVILFISTVVLSATCTSKMDTHCNGSETCSKGGRYPLCPDNWILIDSKCYFFSENKKNKEQSERDCAESGSGLATVKEGLILKLVTITAQEFWIGLTPKGTHYQGSVWSGVWADGSTEKWLLVDRLSLCGHTRQRSVSEGTGTCVKMGHRLSLENCYTELHWICERDMV
ncbi:killer cell lectin-like receptor subfamily F member 2 [Pseudophryne corroboree]|uniref:killer cell lectin-like receptor subfamily F member 2 n=1 Tax=Pseudophryne corroboree TaxID=495146 RepID=UPI00308142E4